MRLSVWHLTGILCGALPALIACAGDGDFKMCTKACTTVNECCTTSPCDTGMNAMKCESGLCRIIGCRSDADCKVMGISIGTCRQITKSATTLGVCGPWCSNDSDCKDPKKCILEVDGSSSKACGYSCTGDADCAKAGSTYKCYNGKYCTASSSGSCTQDSDCASVPGHTRCDVGNKVCTCTGDDICQAAFGTSGGTYRCASY